MRLYLTKYMADQGQNKGLQSVAVLMCFHAQAVSPKLL